jgi:hypothetical protein
MQDVTLKLWDSSSQTTEHFSLITKFTDLGEPLHRKSILGLYINYFFSDQFTTGDTHSFPTDISLSIAYRTDLSDSFANMWSIQSNLDFQTSSAFTKKVIFNEHNIKQVDSVQFRIYSDGLYTKDFGINDFGIIFRPYRTTSTKEFDED